MTKNTKRPDVDRIIKDLKDFQKRTVDYVFSRLYTEKKTDDRFLIADEVGLGKTLVARGVIAKAIHHLWEDINRIDIIYICANSNIARQNINRLNVTGETDFSFATRITMLPLEINKLEDNKLNFISFTPGTSFDLRSQGGRAIERILLYHILKDGWGFGNTAGPKNLFQCGVKKDNWRRRLKNFNKNISPELSQSFLNKLEEKSEIKDTFEELIDRFSHYRMHEHIPHFDKVDRNKFIGNLRQTLAKSCIKKLEPDLVIMDEFQRFKYLLDGDDDISMLANSLFNYKDPNLNDKVKVILLSATPYKMYTMYHESEDDNHYEDLIQTVEFLFDDREKTQGFIEDLKQYRRELYGINNYNSNGKSIQNAKNEIENKLRQIMVRNERVNISRDKNAMLCELKNELPRLTKQELKTFSLLDQIAGIIGGNNIINYWKSAPYLLNFMDKGYKLKKELTSIIENKDRIAQIKDIIVDKKNTFLSWDKIQNYKKLEPGNIKLKSIIDKTIKNGSWKLLWISPSMPYYKVTEGPFSDSSLQDFTKSLIFSSWRIVPRACSMLCSYEAERLMVKSYNQNAKYGDLSSNRSQLLTFSMRETNKPANMSNFCLLYPCITLSKKIDPLTICCNRDNTKKMNINEFLTTVKTKIKSIIDPILQKYANYDESHPDRSWYWASLVLLDKYYHNNKISEWLLNDSHDDTVWGDMLQSEDSDSIFLKHVDLLKYYMKNDFKLGKPPKDLIDVVVKIAVASPAINALRSFRRSIEIDPNKKLNKILLDMVAKTALNFRTLFNRPDVISLIRSIHSCQENRYWESVLDYCINGNIQSMLDEYIHVIRETNGLNNKSSEYKLKEISRIIEEAITIRSVTPQFDEVITNPELRFKNRRIRCHFAMMFGNTKDEEGGKTRIDQVRCSFNSPFRPFILATTSIGQEGLDFHLYSHSIYHWNLPSNPVDLEQREGRIHRYKGHAIRRNVASKNNIFINNNVDRYRDPWDTIFDLAKKNSPKKYNDMVPFWISNPDEEYTYKIYRHVPILPFSKEVNKLEYLKKTIGAYRMVFGQPRQEDLLNYICQYIGNQKSEEELINELKIDLSPK